MYWTVFNRFQDCSLIPTGKLQRAPEKARLTFQSNSEVVRYCWKTHYGLFKYCMYQFSVIAL